MAWGTIIAAGIAAIPLAIIYMLLMAFARRRERKRKLRADAKATAQIEEFSRREREFEESVRRAQEARKSGDVTIGPRTHVSYGAVIEAHRAPVGLNFGGRLTGETALQRPSGDVRSGTSLAHSRAERPD
jgi:hypothetical protein